MILRELAVDLTDRFEKIGFRGEGGGVTHRGKEVQERVGIEAGAAEKW